MKVDSEARGSGFHASYLSLAMEKSLLNCVQQRRELLIAEHPRMLAQERRPAVMGCLVYWFPMLPLGSSHEGERSCCDMPLAMLCLAQRGWLDRWPVGMQRAVGSGAKEAFWELWR